MDQIIEDYLLNMLLIVLSLKIYQTYSLCTSLGSFIHSIEDRPALDPETLRNFITKKRPKKLPKSMDNPYNPDERIFSNFIVKGFVHKTEKATIFSKKKDPLVMRVSFNSPYYLSEEKTLEKDWVFANNNNINKETANFAISDRKDWHIFAPPLVLCNVMKNPDVQWFFRGDDKIVSQKTRENSEDSSFLAKIWGFFKGIFMIQPSFLKMGIENKEFGLKIGSSLGVLGNVIYNYKEKSLRIEKPLFFFKNKEFLVDFFKKTYSHQQKKLFLLFLGGLGLVVFKLFQIFNKDDGTQMQKKWFPGNEIYTNMDENLTCPNCRMKTKNVVLMPCKHLSLCEDCYYLLRDKEKRMCPCCKGKFDDFFKIYIV